MRMENLGRIKMITRKNPLLDTFIDVENGGEGVDTAIRKMDKEFDNVIEGANATQTELNGVKERVEVLDGIDHESFALKSEIPEIVGGSSINVEVSGRENKISVNLPAASATQPDPGLMTQNDKIILENLRNTGETFAGHVVNENIHVPEWTAPEDVGKVLKLTEAGAEWSMGMGPGEFEGVFSINGKQGVLTLEGGGMTEVRTEGEGKIKISTPVIEEATQEKRGLMSAADKGKLNSIPNIPIPKEEDKGKALVYKDDGSLSWETQVTHHLGEIFAYAGTTAPVGAVECKGQAMSKKVYPDLFAVLGYSFGGSGDTFLLPDTYSAGRFLRSRSTIVPVGTKQGDAIRRIQGALSVLADQTHTGSGAFKKSSYVMNLGYIGGTTGGGTVFNFDSQNVVPTAEENRPVNISVMYCIQIVHGYTAPTIMAMDDVVKEIEELKNTAKTHYIGEIFAYAGTTAPMGAVECRGQAMSKTVHPDLFAVLGYSFGGAGDTFHLPDTYSAGRFLRSRSGSVTVGTEQGDAIRNIEGEAYSATAWVSLASNDAKTNGAFYPLDSSGGYPTTGGTASSPSSRLGFDVSRVVPTAEENRPVNISVMYCIQITHGYINSTQIDVDALQKEVIELRNTVQYPPLFIQGFTIEYINSTTIRVNPGKCRSLDDKYNIDLSKTFDVKVNSVEDAYVHFYAILHENNDVTIEAYLTSINIFNNPSPSLFLNEKARRRIGSVIWFKSQLGFLPFTSRASAQSLEVLYGPVISKDLSTTANNTDLDIKIAVPAGITSDALIRMAGGAETNLTASLRTRVSGLTIIYITGSSLPYTFYNEYIPLLPNEPKVRLTCSGVNFVVEVYTCGYRDWRID